MGKGRAAQERLPFLKENCARLCLVPSVFNSVPGVFHRWELNNYRKVLITTTGCATVSASECYRFSVDKLNPILPFQRG